MKTAIITSILLFKLILSFGQNNTSNMVDSLKYLKADTLDCNADLFWRIVAQGEKPFLYTFFFMNSNKRRYQDSVRAWYSREKPKYKSVKTPKDDQNACELKYGIDSYFLWKERP